MPKWWRDDMPQAKQLTATTESSSSCSEGGLQTAQLVLRPQGFKHLARKTFCQRSKNRMSRGFSNQRRCYSAPASSFRSGDDSRHVRGGRVASACRARFCQVFESFGAHLRGHGHQTSAASAFCRLASASLRMGPTFREGAPSVGLDPS